MAAAVRRTPLVRVEDLANRFDVSLETVRRDLVALENEGVLERVYGGARGLPARSFEPPVSERERSQLEAKRAMAQLVCGLLSPGETVIFDVGTSVAEVARCLPWDLSLRVLTASVPAAVELDQRPEVRVLLCGGELRRGDMALSGAQAERFFESFYAEKAILGSGAVHPEAGLTDYYSAEVAVRQLMLAHAKESYVLADSTKLGCVALCRVCGLEALTAVVTDAGADPAVVRALEEAGTRVLVAPPAEARSLQQAAG
jgi:DeoR family fructose operon transcriptional repressor